MRAALRNLRRAPAFTGLVVFTLALGIGATTAMFSVVDAVILRPLPYPNAERFSELWVEQTDGQLRRPGVAGPAIPVLQSHTELFSSINAYQFGSTVVSGGAEPVEVGSPLMTPQALKTLGAVPRLGRLFNDDDVAAGGRVVLISERFWITQFGGDPSVIGRSIALDDQSHEIVGVLPRSFRFPEANAAVWRSLDLRTATAARGRVQAIYVRRPEISQEQFEARVSLLSAGLIEAGALAKNERLAVDLPLQVRFGRESGSLFFVLLGIVSLVLVVACVNVMNLLLARASASQAEFAIRSALGASRWVLLRSVLLESMLLAFAGGVAGLLVAQGLLRIVVAIVPQQLVFMAIVPLEIDARVLAVSLALAALTCVLFAALPAWRASRVDPIDAVKTGATRGAGSRDDRWQSVLVVAQLATVLVLLTGSTLLLRSFATLVAIHPGYGVDGLVSMQVSLPSRRYPRAGMALETLRDVERKIESLGGFQVTVAGAMQAIRFGQTPEAEGAPLVAAKDLPVLPFTEVSPDFFETLQLPILEGRSFRADDADDVIIVTEPLARRFWGKASPVGKRFRMNRDQPWRTVIGVANAIVRPGLDPQLGRGMEVYLQHSANRVGGGFALIARTARPASAALTLMKEQVWAADNRIPISEAATMRERMGERLSQPKFLLELTSGFALTAVLLASVGVYGVAAYWVSRRKRELAVRLAIGATQRAVMALVIRRGLTLSVAGALVGVAFALVAARTLESFVYATDTRDPSTLIVVTLLLMAITLASCIVPAVRASRVDPMSTLRAA